MWFGNRTGSPQVWTTAVHVDGKARSFEAESGLQDVSSWIKLEVSDLKFDRPANTLNVALRLKNDGTRSLTGRVIARVQKIGSRIGTATVQNSSNGASGVGAILDLSDVLDHGRLEPGQPSKETHLRFVIDRPDPFRISNGS